MSSRTKTWQQLVKLLFLFAVFCVAQAKDNSSVPEESQGFPADSALAAKEQTDSTVILETVEVIGVTESAKTHPNQSTLKGNKLRLQQADTLGKTLENQLGISNASFGPGVGIPVIRGLTGSRVRILQDGIGSHDASSISPDHAAAIEPLFAEEIEIVRGPDTIRYGGNAIGGVVDVKDERIPLRVPEKFVSGSIESRFDTNGDGSNSAFKLDLGKDWLDVRVGGFYKNRNNTEIPGQAIDAKAIKKQFELDSIQNSVGEIANTDSESSGGTVGFSWLGDAGMAGMSASYIDNRYGIPNAIDGIDPNDLDGLELILPDLNDLSGFEDILGRKALFPNVRIDMQQTRYDFKGEWYEPLTGIEKISFRYGQVDYRHAEIEGGTPFTVFRNDAGEGRFEVGHRLMENFTGVLGAQWVEREFSALGVEVFVPETSQTTLGFYTTQELTLGDWTLKAGLRTEQSYLNPKANELSLRRSALPPIPIPDELEYQADSAAFSVAWQGLDNTTVNMSFKHSKRSPDIQELLALGPHLSTQNFEIGNVKLKNETANIIDLGFKWETETATLTLDGYYNWADNYIFQRNTGIFYDFEEELIRQRCVSKSNCLPVFAYDQKDASFIGYEAEFKSTLTETKFGRLTLSLFSDYVRGRFSEEGDVPRIAPLRYGSELAFGNDVWNTSVRYTRAENQDNPGGNETASRGYHLLTASADYRLKATDSLEFWLFAKGSNLLNQEVRNSVSFLRNYAPESGRSFVLGFRASF